ncbi:MAG: hypothetical protein KatS3mg044_1043 [Rhodothermaceae bacterium]|nr:MAG: hypothetical protein KatS3mg044_1043 [Rhodothermaceae bacterium]
MTCPIRNRFRPFCALLFVLLFPRPLAAQEVEPAMETLVPPTPAAQRLESTAHRTRLRETSLVRNVAFRNVGPTVMSGRVVDLDVRPDDPTHFYVAFASGGLWKTTNNGQSFTPLFDDQAVMTLGDIAVDWAHGETIWVGTGENNSSRSSYAGTGVYRSTDGGRTWEHLGLAETHRTGRIVLHPEDPNTVWVAAAGHLYSPNPERGVYKTTDGGKTWRKTLFVNDDTGAIDLVLDPTNPAVLYAAMWERSRRAWNFVEGGEGSGIYKSTDGGETWTRLTTTGSGFPTGPNVGRIGLAVYPGDPNIVYALLDNYNRRPPEEVEEPPALTRDMLRTMTREAFLDLKDEDLETFLRENDFPEKYTAAEVKRRVREGQIEPVALVWYLEDANARLFDTPVIGAEVYRSDDGGRTWRRTHEDYIDGLYNSYGYYFGEIRVAPETPERIYILGVPILRSDDGGRTWTNINGENVHVDHHALWVSDRRPGHLIVGNDGGVNISYDDGTTWAKVNTIPVGQFYDVAVDEATPYHVYGGLQDNGVWVGPSTYEHSLGWHSTGDYPYDGLLGGDGMQVAVDTRDNETVYTGFQFGNYFRINRRTGERRRIGPQHELGERPPRFNWETPVHLSRHNQDILYLGANRLYRSLDRGETFEPISDDLTRGGRPGDVPYGTLTTIDESPRRFGLLYTGSDDGLVHVSRDGGFSWTRISDALPQHLWVAHVEASNHADGRVYVALNGYRWDHFDPYLYRSDDYGQTWTRLGTDLPREPVNVVVEDPANEDVLYVGTDHGVYVSLDRGSSFMLMDHNLPYVPVHDLEIQAREKDLVVGTHGRSIFIASIEHVQQLTPALRAEPLHLFTLDDVTHRERWGERRAVWAEYDEPEIELPYYARQAGLVTIRVRTEDGLLLREMTDEAEAGLNYPAYDLTVDPDRAGDFNARQTEEGAKKLKPAGNGKIYLLPGTYTVVLSMGDATAEGKLTVKEPRRR